MGDFRNNLSVAQKWGKQTYLCPKIYFHNCIPYLDSCCMIPIKFNNRWKFRASSGWFFDFMPEVKTALILMERHDKISQWRIRRVFDLYMQLEITNCTPLGVQVVRTIGVGSDCRYMTQGVQVIIYMTLGVQVVCHQPGQAYSQCSVKLPILHTNT